MVYINLMLLELGKGQFVDVANGELGMLSHVLK